MTSFVVKVLSPQGLIRNYQFLGRREGVGGGGGGGLVFNREGELSERTGRISNNILISVLLKEIKWASVSK